MAPDTIRRVSRPRGELTPAQLRTLARATEKRDRAEADYRNTILDIMAEGASYSEVRRATGHSTSTLQAWKADRDRR